MDAPVIIHSSFRRAWPRPWRWAAGSILGVIVSLVPWETSAQVPAAPAAPSPAAAIGYAGTAQFKQATSLPKSRQMHGAAVLGDYLYVLGGTLGSNEYTKSVQKAPINPDRSLGAWSETTPLPANRSYIMNSTLALNDMIYIIGGTDGMTETKLSTAIYAKPDAQGNLSEWRESPPYPGTGLSCFSAVSTPGFIHLIGGSAAGDAPSNAVISGLIDASGGIMAWEQGPPMPSPLWFHSAVAMGGRIWVWGGLNTPESELKGESISRCVFMAPILGTGRIGAWSQHTAPLPAAFYCAANAVAGPYAMAFCPRNAEFAPTTDVWFAVLTPQGLSNWQRVATNIAAKLYISAASDYRRGSVYIPGGRINSGEVDEAVDNHVYLFELSTAARQAAEMSWTSAQGSASAMTPNASNPSAGGAAPESSTLSPQDAGSFPTPATQFSYQAQDILARGAVPGFLSYNSARKQAAGAPGLPGKPLFLYFNLSGAKPCVEQARILQQDPQFTALTQQAAFAWLDIREWPQLANQLGIFRAPAWVLYDPRGNQIGRCFGAVSAPQLAAAINSLK